MPNFICDRCTETFDRLADYEHHVAVAHPGRIVWAFDVESAVAGITFPCSRDELVSHAVASLGPGDERISLLRALPERAYLDVADVAFGLSELKRHRPLDSLARAAEDIEPLLSHARFPATRDELIAYAARRVSADDLRLRVMAHLPSRTFKDAEEVAIASRAVTATEVRP